MKTKIIIVLVIGLLLSSCSKTEYVTPMEGDTVKKSAMDIPNRLPSYQEPKKELNLSIETHD